MKTLILLSGVEMVDFVPKYYAELKNHISVSWFIWFSTDKWVNYILLITYHRDVTGSSSVLHVLTQNYFLKTFLKPSSNYCQYMSKSV